MKIAVVLLGLLSLVEFSGAFFYIFRRPKLPPTLPKCRRVGFWFFARKVCDVDNDNRNVKNNPSSDYCVCSGSGDPHYKTFDGATIHFMGICKYTLAQLLDKNKQCYFNVEIKNEHRGRNRRVAYTRLVDVKLKNYVIRLHKRRRVFVNKIEKFLPVTLANGVAITRSGNNVVVKTICGAEIMFDGKHVVTVKIPKEWGAGKMNGICGSCNGNANDDFMTLQGVNVAGKSNKYNLVGNSYSVPDDSDQPRFHCKQIPPFPVCTAQQMTLFQDSPQYCGLLKDQGGSFGKCIKSKLVDMDGYLQSCKMDLCANYQSVLEVQTICESLESAAKDCANKGIMIDWRQPAFCPMTCGANEEYNFKAPGCEASCLKPEVTDCIDPPSEGCVCKSGYVRSGNACVKKSECGCVDGNGDYYPMGAEKRTENCGEVFQCKFIHGKTVLTKIRSGITCHKDATCSVKNGEHTCVCKPGYAGDGVQSCINLRDRCTCTGSGDPHYYLFDGQRIDFMGVCMYTLSQLTERANECWFSVEVKNERRGWNWNVAWTRMVDFAIYGQKVRILGGRRVQINGRTKYLPIELAGGKMRVFFNGNNVQVDTNCGITVMFDGVGKVVVNVPSHLGNLLQGICGNCNGRKDDFKTKDGNDVSNDRNRHNLIGMSYTVVDDSDSITKECTPPIDPPRECPAALAQAITGDDMCGMIKDTAGPFRECILAGVVDVEQYFDSCRSDICQYDGGEGFTTQELVCDSLSGFAAVCNNYGFEIFWRTAELCPLPCGPNEEYSPAVNPCPETCNGRITGAACNGPRVEGCQCKSGFVMSSDMCVPKAKCGCKDNQGNYYPIGAQYRSTDCSTLYSCKLVKGKAKLVTEDRGEKCHKDATCGVKNGEMGCVCKEGYAGDGVYSCVDTTRKCRCSATGDPHYKTYDGQMIHFQGTCRYTLTQSTTNKDECAFNVEVKNENRYGNNKVSWTKMVAFEIYGLEILLLTDNKVLIDREERFLPFTMKGGKLRVSLVAGKVQVDTECGISVIFDGIQDVIVEVPKEYANKMTGICGDCDGEKNDWKTKEGDDLSEYQRNERDTNIGNSYIVEEDYYESEGKCQTVKPLPGCNKETYKKFASTDYCGYIIDIAGPFKECIESGVIETEGYFESCREDLCAYQQKGSLKEQKVVCKSMTSFAAACNAAGFVSMWRNEKFCPMKCPSGQVYNTSVSACPATCGEPAPQEFCNTPVKEGCQCKGDFILNDKKCTKKQDCGCTDEEGNYLPIGEKRISDDCSEIFTCVWDKKNLKSFIQTTKNGKPCHADAECKVVGEDKKCVCDDGYEGDGFTCTEIPPTTTTTTICRCSATGDPHYKTYDGQMIHFQGTCRYTLTQSTTENDECAFNVEVKIENRHGKNKVSWTKMVAFEIYGLEILLLPDKKVLIDREKRFLPVTMKGGKLRVSLVAGKVQVDTECGIRVIFDGIQDVSVEVPKEYANKMTGICGDCDGEKNDWKTKEGDDLSEYQQNERDTDIGNSYIVEEDYYESEEKCQTVKPPPGCNKETYKKFASTDYCGNITGIAGPFKECIESGVIKAEGYFESCRKDLCAYKQKGFLKEQKVVCKSMTSFAAACNATGFVSMWRNEKFCQAPEKLIKGNNTK